MPIANTSPNSYMQINGFVMSTVSPSTLRERLQADPALAVLDVRTPAEFAQVHVPGAQLAPLDQLKPEELVGQGIHKNAPLFLLCRSGQRDTLAATRLEGAGYTRCHVVEGGTLAWEAAGFPVERGESGVISLERQVRIGAGALVVGGVLLARFAHPAFLWLSGCVGAGLVFAGVTDTCGMGMLLAKAPWNQAPTTAPKTEGAHGAEVVLHYDV